MKPGRSWAITTSSKATIVSGDARGRTLGFPTANLSTANELIPPNGVYASYALLDGRVLPAVTNIGVNPTFGPHQQTIETHLLDFAGDLYGRQFGLAFVQRLREERTYADAGALVAQISADCGHARDLFRRISL